MRRYKTEDATAEKFSEILLENSRRILVHRDEFSGWLRNLDNQGMRGIALSTRKAGTAREALTWTA